jgi:hypothetical protein
LASSPADHLSLQIVLALHDLLHLRLELRQVLFLEGPGQIEIVIEPVFDGRPDGDFRLGKFSQHRFGHHVGHGVTDPVQPVLIVLGVAVFFRDCCLRHTHLL